MPMPGIAIRNLTNQHSDKEKELNDIQSKRQYEGDFKDPDTIKPYLKINLSENAKKEAGWDAKNHY